MFNTLLDVLADTAKIMIAPVEIVAAVVAVPVKAVADVATELVNDVKSLKD